MSQKISSRRIQVGVCSGSSMCRTGVWYRTVGSPTNVQEYIGGR